MSAEKMPYEAPRLITEESASAEELERMRKGFGEILKDQGLTPDKKRKVVDVKKGFESRHPRAPKKIEKAEEAKLDERLFDESIVPATERESFLAAFELLPRDDLKTKYIQRVKSALGFHEEVRRITSLRGASFEMTRINTLVSQGLEQFDFSGNGHEALTVDYQGYPLIEDDSAVDFSIAPTRAIRKAPIELDAPVLRGDKAHVYEVKSYPRSEYGKGTQSKNQLLKYQAAVERGLVEGATIEISGRINRNFLGWALGERLDDPGHIPDIEIIYSFPLPSGQEFRFPLKRARKGAGLKFENDEQYPEEDLRVIRGIQKSLADKEIIKLIADINISPDAVSDELRPFLDDPSSIPTIAQFQEFERVRMATIYDRLRDKDGYINTDNKKSAASEYANREFIERLVVGYQDYLRTNPEIATVKHQYVLDEKKPELLAIATEKTFEVVERIRNYELSRAADPEERKRRIKRTAQGYKGRPEGVALDIEHIMIDVVYAMNKEGMERDKVDNAIGADVSTIFFEPSVNESRVKSRFRTIEELENVLTNDPGSDAAKAHERLPRKKREALRRLIKESAFVRSYTWPERFSKIEDLIAQMKDQDRRYMELQILDGKDGVVTRQANTNEAEVERTRAAIIRENIKRAGEYIQGTKRAPQNRRIIMGIMHDIQDSERERDEKMKAQQAIAQEEAKTISKEIERIKKEGGPNASEQISALSERRTRVFDEVKTISTQYQAQLAGLYESLEQTYRTVIPAKEWEKFERRIVALVDQNIAKFIYATTAEGEIIVQEEVLRGDVSGRAAHSELAQGRNIYGAGELKFEKRSNGQWTLVEINNGSGHYRPDANSNLHYIRNLMQSKNFDIREAQLVDSLLRGIDVRNRSAF